MATPDLTMATPDSRDGIDAVPATFARSPVTIIDVVGLDTRDRIARLVDLSPRPPVHYDFWVTVSVPMTASGRRGEFADALLAEDGALARPSKMIQGEPTRSARDMLSQID